jgi:catechol 2,3-dioxygenase-like lactoylglutathione lyase family enzyme
MSEVAGTTPTAVRSRPDRPLLGAIRAATLTASDIAAVEAAWTKWMGYEVAHRGPISESVARAWGAPALAGRQVVVLGPTSGAPTYLRFVEQDTPDDGRPKHAQGWTTVELTVRNSDELYERLKDSPFRVAGPPRTVPTYEYLRAMQATGPAGEHLNLTWITEHRPDLAVAESFVDRCFITVMGVPDLPAALKFYEDTFGNAASPIRQLPQFKLAVVVLNDGSKIEIDEQAGPPPRPRAPGGLPPGLAMTTFECAEFDRFADRFIAPPIAAAFPPFAGRRVGVISGAAGELLELIEA